MAADAFLALPESQVHLELVNGLIIVSPSPSYWQKKIVFEKCRQIDEHVKRHPIGDFVQDIDVKLRDDLAYRPDMVFLRSAKAARVVERITEPPDLVVEVVSPGSRSLVTQTKRGDYEAAGVGEYWLIDPEQQSFGSYVLELGTNREASASGGTYASTVIPGFQLDVERIRRMF